MKAPPLIFSIALMAAPVAAQSPARSSEPPDIVVLQNSWHKEHRYPSTDTNPLKVNEDQQDLVRAQKRTIARNEDRVSQNATVIERIPGPIPVPPAPASQAVTAYVYIAQVKNTGPKTIKAISWEYVFIDPDTGEQMGTHKATSKVKIHPRETRELSAKFSKKPTQIINAGRVGAPLRDQFTERVIIRKVEYTDGSVWESRSN